MMMNSKRSDGRRLLLVVALIGILSTYGTSAQNNEVTVSDAASTEESLESTATLTGGQSTAEGTDTSETQEVTTGASAGETATSPGETLPGATGDGQTGNIVGETSIAEGRTVETATSTGEFSTAGRVSGQVLTGVESSAGGTEGGTTSAVREASSAGATGTENQITVGETTATLTGATSTDEAVDGPLGAVHQQEKTTGATTAEESLTTSVKQTSKAADAQYTTNVEDRSTERQTETIVPSKVTEAAVTTASTGCNSTDTCERCELRVNKQLWYTGSICKAEAGFQYCLTTKLHNQKNPNRPRSETRGISRKVICSTLLNPLKEEISKRRDKIRNRPTTPRPTTTSRDPDPERKRRQANEATTSEPLDELDWDDSDIDELWEATIRVIDKIVGDSGENSSQALQSTQSLVESSMTSATTSTVLASTSAVKDVSVKVEDPKRLEERTQPAKENVWDAHRGIFLTVLIIISVCVVVTGFCCLVMKCRERGQNRNSEKQPIAMEEAREAPTSASNPIPDHEMIQDEGAPMQERENPAVTPNGGGQHISKADEDNGWVVPLDELSNAEKEKPEVENTRL